MPRAVPVTIRQLLWLRQQQGESTTTLAAAYDASTRGVRALLHRLQLRGPLAIRPDYHAPPRSRTLSPPPAERRCCNCAGNTPPGDRPGC